MLSLKEKTSILIKEMSEKLIEREHAVPMLFLTLFSNSNILLLGPPGVGKTHMVGLMMHCLENLKFFEYLITGNTSFDELFGTQVTNANGGTEYNIDHSMLDSEIVFIDEVYKAPPSILNSFLGIAHYSRSFYQRGRGMMKAPVKMIVLASNEVPDNDAAEAFEDRVGIKLYIDEIKQAGNFKRYVKREFDRTTDFSVKITEEELRAVSVLSKEVYMHDQFVLLYAEIKNKLSTEKVVVSDRKSSGSLDIFQVSAYINNREFVNLTELFLLLDIAWRKPSDIPRVRRVIFDSVFGNLSDIQNTLNKNQDYYKNVISNIRGNVGNILSYKYNFNGVRAGDEFMENREALLSVAENVLILVDNCSSLKSNYTFAKEMEKEIEDNVFIPNYKNHIYSNDESVGEKRVSSDDIFRLASDVEMINGRLQQWLKKNGELLDYQSNQLSE